MRDLVKTHWIALIVLAMSPGFTWFYLDTGSRFMSAQKERQEAREAQRDLDRKEGQAIWERDQAFKEGQKKREQERQRSEKRADCLAEKIAYCDQFSPDREAVKKCNQSNPCP